MSRKRNARLLAAIFGKGAPAVRRPLLAVALALVLCVGAACLPGCQPASPAADGGEQSLAQTGSGGEAASDPRLTFTVNLDDDEFQDVPLVVKVEGEGADGEDFSRQYRALPGHVYDLSCDPGTYRFSVEADAPYDDAYLCVPTSASCVYDGEEGQEVVLAAKVDREAMEAAAAEKAAAEARAAEEARLAAEAQAAEDERKAQEAAAAAAAAEAQRKAQEEAAAAQKSTHTVYITNTGEKYHRDGCRHLSKSKIPIDYADARAKGYAPCKVCSPG